MKKFLFFKSATSNGNGNSILPTSKDKKQESGKEDFGNSPGLRRSRSYSSGAALDGGLQRTRNGSPYRCTSNDSLRQTDRPGYTLTPDRQSRAKWFEDTAHSYPHDVEGFEAVPSESSSYCSTNASLNVLDRYIDGEHQEKCGSMQKKSSSKSYGGGLANGGGKLPPRFQYAAPASPTDSMKQKPRSHSFREVNKEPQLYISSRDWVEDGFGNESPRQLAKHVIERLSQSRVKKIDPDPITIEDIYGGSVRKCPGLPPGGVPKEVICFPDESRQCNYDESVEEELGFVIQRLENEKNDLQLSLEKELDRRSNEWSCKLEKYQAEEHRLRERVRELAEQNVSLQKEVSSLSERERDSRTRLTFSDRQVEDLSSRVGEVTEENQNLKRALSELQEKYRASEEDRECFQRNYEDKENECKELHRAVTRLLRSCNDQEKTIGGLREGLSEELRKKPDHKHLTKLQMEQIRLTGVEQALRKEVESHKIEVDSLRHENINLLNRMKGNGGFSTLKFDQEVFDRVQCLQSQGLHLVNQSTQLCTKLLESIKSRAGHSSEATKSGSDSQFILESDVKLQGFKRGAETLTRGLQNISSLVHEKSNSLGSGSDLQNSHSSKDVEFKAEALLTSLLREKLYSKEVEIEQFQAELAAAVRSNDILKCEVQNAMDSLSCVTHKMKDLELQIIKKDENIYRMQNDLQDCKKELNIVKGILPKVSEERDIMWEDVKQFSENNMLLNSEVGMLKKKVEALEEDILLKEGQITILKDALGKPFDLLASPDNTREFLLE